MNTSMLCLVRQVDEEPLEFFEKNNITFHARIALHATCQMLIIGFKHVCVSNSRRSNQSIFGISVPFFPTR